MSGTRSDAASVTRPVTRNAPTFTPWRSDTEAFRTVTRPAPSSSTCADRLASLRDCRPRSRVIEETSSSRGPDLRGKAATLGTKAPAPGVRGIKSRGVSAEQKSMRAHGRRPMLRLFAASATLSLIPVLILGLILSTSYRSEARRRGIAEGASEAQLIAQTAIGPQLDGTPLRARLDGEAYSSLVAMTRTAEKQQHILRLRLRPRSLNGDVVFSDDGSGFTDRPDDEAIDAARGETVARLTRTNSDGNDEGPAGVDAVEVYLPLTTGTQHLRVGVLEIYLPYGP